jgi:hypothetical protein
MRSHISLPVSPFFFIFFFFLQPEKSTKQPKETARKIRIWFEGESLSLSLTPKKKI